MASILMTVAAYIMLLSILIITIRFLKGPTLVDRVIAFDAMGIISISLIVMIGFFSKRIIYIDVASVYALLSFLGVIVIARYLEKGL